MLNLSRILDSQPSAQAIIKGSAAHPTVNGSVRLYQTRYGTLVYAEIQGLPYENEPCPQSIFGFHIHDGESCTGNDTDPFEDALGHYNPFDCPHPQHSGDLPPLFGNQGFACMAVLTDRFTTDEVIGKTVIIHSSPDDFTSQPAGNSGTKIACGKIQRSYR